MKQLLLRSLFVLPLLGSIGLGQTLYTPGGTVGTSANWSVTIVTAAKGTAPSGGQGQFMITSNESSNQLMGGFSLVTDPTSSNRRLTIQAIEQGAAWRNITLAENGGNVGIGASTPISKLDVYNSAVNNAPFQNLTVQGADANVENSDGTYSDSNPSWGIGFTRDWNSGGNRSLGAGIYSYGTTGWGQGLIFRTSPGGGVNPTMYTRMVIGDTGNIGIGIATPVSYGALDVNTTGNKAIHMMDSALGGLLIGYNGPTIQARTTADANTANLLLQYWGGNVGIGTANPTYKLEVNGTIHTKDVTVDNNGWPDYVFDKDYKLPALSEVEATIKAEKHLPGLPSAQEVAEHGVSLGDMQARMLAKIEELTLHQIQQEKEIAALRAENAELRTEVRTRHAPANRN